MLMCNHKIHINIMNCFCNSAVVEPHNQTRHEIRQYTSHPIVGHKMSLPRDR